MILFSIHLPTKLVLSVKLTKKHKNLDEKPLLPPLGRLLRAKKGNIFSRLFRHVFEHDKIKKIVGTNLTFLVVASALIPTASPSSVVAVEINSVSSPLILKTQAGIQYPVHQVRITQGYRNYHRGVDLDGVTGDLIRPIMPGTVKAVENSRFGYGKSVIVDHGNGVSSRYAHLSKIEVSVGQEVSMGSKIGEMGATGRSFGDHLHLEIYENGKAINPISVLK